MTQYLPLSLSLAIRRSCACIAPSRDCVLSTCAHRMRRSDQSPRGGTRRPACVEAHCHCLRGWTWSSMSSSMRFWSRISSFTRIAIP